MTITLTQVLAEQQSLRLFGRRITDLVPSGDLGLGLDPEGPVGFAWVRAWAAAKASPVVLCEPIILTVYGPGEDATEHLGHADERCWSMRVDEPAWRLVLQRDKLAGLLAL